MGPNLFDSLRVGVGESVVGPCWLAIPCQGIAWSQSAGPTNVVAASTKPSSLYKRPADVKNIGGVAGLSEQ